MCFMTLARSMAVRMGILLWRRSRTWRFVSRSRFTPSRVFRWLFASDNFSSPTKAPKSISRSMQSLKFSSLT